MIFFPVGGNSFENLISEDMDALGICVLYIVLAVTTKEKMKAKGQKWLAFIFITYCLILRRSFGLCKVGMLLH